LEFELFRRCFPLHPICHHLQSEYVKVEGMDMPDVEGINMLEEHDHPSNHRSGEEGMNMVGIHMMELEVMDMSEERPTKERSEDDGYGGGALIEPSAGGGGYGYCRGYNCRGG
jgi:hypothetical protein